VLTGFQIDGIEGLRRKRPGPPPLTDRRHRITERVFESAVSRSHL